MLRLRLRLANPTGRVSRPQVEYARQPETGFYNDPLSMVHLLDHPLATHVVTHLRDQTTKPATFRTLAYQISLLLALEATRDLATREITIQTPLEPHLGGVLSQPIVVVP